MLVSSLLRPAKKGKFKKNREFPTVFNGWFAPFCIQISVGTTAIFFASCSTFRFLLQYFEFRFFIEFVYILCKRISWLTYKLTTWNTIYVRSEFMCAYLYSYTYVHAYIRIHTYTHICIPTYIYTYICAHCSGFCSKRGQLLKQNKNY